MTLHLIRPNADGTFEPGDEGEPGCIRARCLRVTVEGEWYDTIGWSPDNPSVWWTRRGLVPFIGSDELSSAWYDERSARFVPTPQDYLLRRGHAVCVIDWRCDLNHLIGTAGSVICSTPALAEKMKRTLLQQSRPRIIDCIYVAESARAAA